MNCLAHKLGEVAVWEHSWSAGTINECRSLAEERRKLLGPQPSAPSLQITPSHSFPSAASLSTFNDVIRVPQLANDDLL